MLICGNILTIRHQKARFLCKKFGAFNKKPYIRSQLTKILKTMDKEFLIHLCGWVASIGLILGYLPQAIQTIRTRNTDGISLPGFIMMAIGCFAFVVQGLLIENYYLLLTNLITFTCSVIIFVIKMQNDLKKR